MKSFLVAALMLAMIISPSLADQSRPVPPAEAEVRRLEREWLDAYEKHDAKEMDRIVAADFMITFPDGETQDKPSLMSQISAPRPATSPAMRFLTENVKSRSYGDTVILTGVVVTSYERDGKPIREEMRYTDTYVRRDGKWQVVASHLSNVPKAATGGK